MHREKPHPMSLRGDTGKKEGGGVLAAFARGWSQGLVLGVLANEPSWGRQGS